MPGSAHPGSGYQNQSQPNDFGSQNVTRNAKTRDSGPEASRGPNAGSRPDFERGEERPRTDPPEDRYDPSAEQVTRGRSQGLGMGERDLERQRDPRRPAPPPGEDDRPDGE